MIKKMLLVKKDIDITSYHKLVSYLKNNSVGHVPKKAMVLSKDEVIKFIADAADDIHLMNKVALIFGIYGACRREELANMSVNDIEDRGSVLVVTIPKTKTNMKRIFTILDDDVTSSLALFRKYVALRPANINHSRFFVQYRKKKCTAQAVGKNTFGSIPKMIAKYLELPNPERYSGHTFRRTSATLLADSGADITCVKRHGGWKSSSVAEGYLEDSIQSKNRIACSILSAETQFPSSSKSLDVDTIIGINSGQVATVESTSLEDNVDERNNLNFSISNSSEAISVRGITFQHVSNCVFNFNQ